jgi:hypothetical protein
MKKIILLLTLLALTGLPFSARAVSLNSRDVSGIVKITSKLAKESIDLQVRSTIGFLNEGEAVEYRKILEAEEQVGSGFMVTYSGCVLTNKHVVYDLAASVAHQDIHLWSTGRVNAEPVDLGEAELVYYRTLEDLALVCLKDTGGKFYHRTFVKTDAYGDLDLTLGEEIYTLGYPQNGGDYPTLTSGMVSGVWDEQTVKTTMPITAGASGSPVFNRQGLVVGLAVANTGPFDQLGLFLKPDLVINWYKGYEEVYRSAIEESRDCLNTETDHLYKQDDAEYYDLKCSLKRNFGLEQKLVFEYKNQCGGELAQTDLVEAAGYIASGRSTINHWVGYVESACLPPEPVSVLK